MINNKKILYKKFRSFEKITMVLEKNTITILSKSRIFEIYKISKIFDQIFQKMLLFILKKI